jgi:hypothetical protein
MPDRILLKLLTSILWEEEDLGDQVGKPVVVLSRVEEVEKRKQ